MRGNKSSNIFGNICITCVYLADALQYIFLDKLGKNTADGFVVSL